MRLKPVTDYAVYLTVRSLLCLIQAMPLESGYRLAQFLGRLAYAVDLRHRDVAMDNLRHAFPGQYTQDQLQRLVQVVYRHFATIIIEIAHIPRRLRATTWQRYIRLCDRKLMVNSLIGNRPVILLTAHLGNWEMAGYILGEFGFKPYSVTRTLDNSHLERLIRSFRTQTGQRIIYKRGAFDQVAAVMDRKGVVAILSDQDAGHRGVFVEYLGRPASTHKGVALLALKHDAPICLGFARRITDRFRYEVWSEGIIDPRDYQHLPDPIWSITQECARGVERAVRRAPEQYFWLHRRWKHQPPAKSRQAA